MKHQNLVRLSLLQHITLLVMAGILVVGPRGLYALPTGIQVAHGGINMATDGQTMDLTQSGMQAIANWQSFSIGAGETVNINQPGIDAALLSRVTGADPSRLLGQLNASGRVFLINPNGIVIGKNARIDTAEFFASALDVSDEDFLNGGNLIFEGDSAAAVVNLGSITAENGDVILLAYRVVNEGEIKAPQGTAALGAGNSIVLTPEDDQRLLIRTEVAMPNEDTGVDNDGIITAVKAELKAAGSDVYAMAINQSGYIQATGVEQVDGRILLTAAGGDIRHSGTLSASNADGSGGEVLLGGDYRGANTAISNARQTEVTAGAVIDVSAQSRDADAGRAIVWADEATTFAGYIDGRGGALGGNGAFAEVSGKEMLHFSGIADLRAPAGQVGELLLDPDALTVQATGVDTNITSSGADPVTFEQTTDADSILLVSTLEAQLALSAVTLDASTVDQANGTITVNDPVTWASGNTLRFKAGDSININADLDGTGAEVILGLGFRDDFLGVQADLIVDADATITADRLTIGRNTDAVIVGANEDDGLMGDLMVSGALVVNTLDLQIPESGGFEPGGIGGSTVIDNANNQIGTLTSSVTGGLLKDVTVVDGGGGLIVDASFTDATGAITIVTTGDLTLNSGTAISTSFFGDDIYLAARSGSFINNAGATALVPGDGGRFLVYSDDPANTVKGGLVGDPVYNKTFDVNAPDAITQTGNRFLYSLAPSLTFAVTNQTREYGEANSALAFIVSGLVGGDLAADVYSGDPTLSTTITAATNAGFYDEAIAIANGTLALSDFDYQLALVPGNITIDPATLTVTANGQSRLFGDPNPSFDGVLTGFKLDEDTDVLTTQPTFGTTAIASSGVGTYPISGSGGTATNYTFDFVDGTLTINPAPLTITADDASREYGDANPDFSASFSGFKLTDDASVVSGLTLTTTATEASDAGSYDIEPGGATADNYAITFVDGTLTVDPAPLTIVADDKDRLYGATNPVFTGMVTGLKLGQDVSVLPNLAYGTTAVTNSDVGTYAITPTGATNENYSYNYVDGTLTIDPAQLTITADNAAKLFNDPLPDLSATFTGLVADDTEADIGTPTLTTTAVQSSPVGVYSITPSGLDNPNYIITFVDGALSISNQILTVTADDFTRLYGEANPDFTATITGFVGDDDESVLTAAVTFTTAADINTGVGTFAIIPSGATAPNYDITFVNGTLTIDPALLTITAADLSREYGDTNPVFFATFDGLVADDTGGDIPGLILTTSATRESDAGPYPIEASGASNANYDITFVDGTLTVETAPLSIVIDDQMREYGDTNPALSSMITGFKLTDDISVLTGLSLETSAVQDSDVGDYAITSTPVSATNYDITVENGILSINPAPLTITADDLTREYGDANPVLTTQITGFKLTDDTSVLSGLTVTTSATAESDIGDYAIVPSGAISTNYAITFEDGLLTVLAAPLTISADDVTRAYGDPNPGFTATFDGLKPVDDPSIFQDLIITTEATAMSGVGNYTLSPSGAISDNYIITLADGNLSVDPRPLTITGDDVSKVFGDELPELSVTFDGLAAFDDASVIANLNVASDATQRLAPAGSHPVTVSGASNPNYAITLVDGTATVTPRPASVIALNASRTYGESNPTLFITTENAVNDGAPINLADLIVSTSAQPDSDVGSYAITLSNAFDPNYELTFVDGTLTVTPAPVTFSADSFTREYGDPNPELTFEHTELRLGQLPDDVLENITFTTVASQESNAGFYSIDLSADIINSNYAVTLEDGLLTVDKAPLFVVPALTERFYGDGNPTPGIVATGLKNDDTAAVVTNPFFLNETLPDAAPGSYPVSIIAAIATNYDLSFGTGLINVLPRPLTIRADSFTREYGDPNPVLTASFDGLASFDDPSVIPDVILTTPATIESHVLDWGITVDSGLNPNYDISFEQGILSVTPAPLVITVGDTVRLFGRGNPEFTPTSLFGLKLDDTQDDLGLTFETDATAASDVGVYDVRASMFNSNYTTEFEVGRLFVDPAPIQVTVLNQSRRYGEANDPEFEVTAFGLALGQTADEVVVVTNPTTAESDVGTYPLLLDLTTDNYLLTDLQGGQLTILPRNLALKPANVTRFYGDADPIFEILVAGDGLADFDTIDDVAFSGDILIDGSFGQQAPVGARLMTVQLTGNPNYDVTNRAGVYTILPRPIELTVTDATATGNFPLPNFSAEATNLAEFDSLAGAFPNLGFRIFNNDEPAPTGTVIDPETYEVPDVFDDDVFFASFPTSIGVDDPPVIDPGPGGTVIDFQPIEIVIDPGTSVGPKLVILDEITIVASTLFTPGQREGTSNVRQFISPIGYSGNTNYVVTKVNNGTLTWQPDPAVEEQRQAIERELDIYEENYDAFWGGDLAGSTGLFGLNQDALPVIFAAIASELAIQEAAGETDLADQIARSGAIARGSTERELTGGAHSDFDVLAFLAAAAEEPSLMEILAPIVTNYAIALTSKDPANYTSAEQAFANQLSGHLTQARDDVASKMENSYDAWSASNTSTSGAGLTSLFGTTTPYNEFIGDAVGQMAEQNLLQAAGAIGVGSGAIGGGAAATATMVAATTIFPHAFTAAMAEGGSVASASTVATGMASAGVASAGAAAAVAAGIAIGVTRGIQVFEEAEQKEIYDNIVGNVGQPVSLSDLQMVDENGQANTVDQSIFLGAMMSLFSTW